MSFSWLAKVGRGKWSACLDNNFNKWLFRSVGINVF